MFLFWIVYVFLKVINWKGQITASSPLPLSSPWFRAPLFFHGFFWCSHPQFSKMSAGCAVGERIAFFRRLLLFARVFLLPLLELVGFVQSIQCSTVRTCICCTYPTLSTRLTFSFLLMVSPQVTEHLVLLFCEFTAECTPKLPSSVTLY